MSFFGVPTRNGLPIGLGSVVVLGVDTGGASPPVPATNPPYQNVVMLLPGSGTNGAQNNTFLDSSANAFAITRNGNSTQGTFSPYGDNWSNYFDGTGDTLTWSGSTVGTNDFCFECWFYAIAFDAQDGLLGGTTNGCLDIRLQAGSNNILVGARNTNSRNFAFTITANSWNHLAVSRVSGTISVFLNGTRSSSGAQTYTQSFAAPTIIGDHGDSNFFNGYLSNVRLVIGSSPYDPTQTTLTVPTAPLTAISGTSLLTCQSNRFIDNSSNNFTITRNGDVSVQRFSPFSPTASYSASTIGGSGYFDGVGDYLSVPDNAALDLSGDFTIEFWMRPVPRAGEDFPRLISKGDYQTATTSWVVIMQAGASNKTGFWYGNPATELNIGNAPPNTWTHIAIARSGTTLRSFFNGTLVSTNTTSADFTSTDNVLIGAGSLLGSTQLFSGYISNLRILKGTAQYTASFTPPTAPVTAIANTSLLLNFTNGAIIDNAMMNDAETVGNAQISTAQSKWGGGSMAFDGTGDWLTAPHSVTQQLGSGNFTVEGWLRINAIGVAYGVVSKGTATTGYSVNVTSGNKLRFSYTATQLTGATSLAANTWYHFAVVRNGTGTGNLVLYLDGVADATSAGAVTDTFNQTNIQYVGADRVGGSSLNGYIDDLRITNGVARYTANFTPPTAAFPLF